jgi:hypothetical protein
MSKPSIVLLALAALYLQSISAAIVSPDSVVAERIDKSEFDEAAPRGLAQLHTSILSASSTTTVPASILKAATIVFELSDPTSTLYQQAKRVVAGTADAATILAVQNEFESWELAPSAGVEITSMDNDQLTNQRSPDGRIVRAEEMCTECYQGDIRASSKRQLELLQLQARTRKNHGAGKPWPNAEIKYCLHPKVPTDLKEVLAAAIKQMKKVFPCMSITDVGLKSVGNGQETLNTYGAIEKANPKNPNNWEQALRESAQCNADQAVFITGIETGPNGGCWSRLGKIDLTDKGFTQGLNLATGCKSLGTTLHELGHVFGMDHEQSRPDRDTYVKVYTDRINNNGKGQFGIAQKEDTHRPYDVLSLMHYGKDDFLKKGKPSPVIEVLPKGYAKYTTKASEYHKYQPGDRNGWTQSDIDQLADLYKAVKSSCRANTLTKDQAACKDMRPNGQDYQDAKTPTELLPNTKWTGPWQGKGKCSDYAKDPTTCQFLWGKRLPGYRTEGAQKACCVCKGGYPFQVWKESKAVKAAKDKAAADKAAADKAAADKAAADKAAADKAAADKAAADKAAADKAAADKAAADKAAADKAAADKAAADKAAADKAAADKAAADKAAADKAAGGKAAGGKAAGGKAAGGKAQTKPPRSVIKTALDGAFTKASGASKSVFCTKLTTECAASCSGCSSSAVKAESDSSSGLRQTVTVNVGTFSCVTQTAFIKTIVDVTNAATSSSGSAITESDVTIISPTCMQELLLQEEMVEHGTTASSIDVTYEVGSSDGSSPTTSPATSQQSSVLKSSPNLVFGAAATILAFGVIHI